MEESRTVANHHAETLIDLFGEHKSTDYEDAALITIQGGTEWVVMKAGDMPTSQACTERRLISEPKPDRPRHFAILGDDILVARRLTADLAELGFEAAAFATEAEFEAGLQYDSFDAHVIDWVLPNWMAEAFVAKLRSRSANLTEQNQPNNDLNQ